jgi:hypothetical protein
MSGLTCVGGREFFDNAEVWRFNEVPAIAVSSVLSTPIVALGRFRADFLCRHGVPKGIYTPSRRQPLSANCSIADNDRLAADSNLLENSCTARERNVYEIASVDFS